jgi:hypothetical protein
MAEKAKEMKESAPDPEPSWYTLKQLAPLMGMSTGSIKNAIARGNFPIPTYFLGRHRVVDKQVLEAFFSAQRDEGLRRMLANPKPTRPR